MTGTINSGKTSLVSSDSNVKTIPLNKIKIVRKNEIMVGTGCVNGGSVDILSWGEEEGMRERRSQANVF